MKKTSRICLAILFVSIVLLLIVLIFGSIYQNHNGLISSSSSHNVLWINDVLISLFGVAVLSVIGLGASVIYDK